MSVAGHLVLHTTAIMTHTTVIAITTSTVVIVVLIVLTVLIVPIVPIVVTVAASFLAFTPIQLLAIHLVGSGI